MVVEAIFLLWDTLNHGWKHLRYNPVASKSASAPASNLTVVEAETVMKSTKHTVPMACLLLRFIRNWSSLQLANNGVGRMQGLYRVCLPSSTVCLGLLDRYYWPGARTSVMGSCPMSCLFKDLELKNKSCSSISLCTAVNCRRDDMDKEKSSFLYNSVSSLPLLSFFFLHLRFLRYGFACLELSL